MPATAEPHLCVDCILDPPRSVRPAPHGGPRSRRCVTHWRARQRASKIKARTARVKRDYDLEPGEYEAVKAFQGGRCGLCGVATGSARALAVEHEHYFPGCTHPPERGCANCFRGLACSVCNEALGRFNVETLARMIRWKLDPPGRSFLAQFRRAKLGNEPSVTYPGHSSQNGHDPFEEEVDLFEGNHRGGPNV